MWRWPWSSKPAPVLYRIRVLRPMVAFGRMRSSGIIDITQEMFHETLTLDGDSWIFYNQAEQREHFGDVYYELL